MTNPRILCVDDEPHVLAGLRRVFRRQYDVSVAEGAEAALASLAQGPPFAVVISDMRMPGMSGAALLAEVWKRAPDTVRMLLTGQADLESAILAVNEGHLFRFLTKPCPPEALSKAIDAAVAQHRLITSEKVLLEQTLVGSMRVLSEVLALVHPQTFGVGARRHQRARAVAHELGQTDAWHVEVASMLTSVGYVVLPAEVVTKLEVGAPLDGGEVKMTEQVPDVVERVLSHIPRLERVRDVLAHCRVTRGVQRPATRKGPVPLGAHVLNALQDLSVLEAREGNTAKAIAALRAAAAYESTLLDAVARVVQPFPPELRSLALNDLQTDMVLASDVKSSAGALLVARGQPVTVHLIQRLRNFNERGGVAQPIVCEVPRHHASAGGSRSP
jgi:DNA-binding NarL/FixJ family response regulator